MEQLILHAIGDYVLQSDWMANGKTSKYGPALAHAMVYSAPFLLLSPSLSAFLVIGLTHFFIDRFRLAKYICYAKNFIAPPAAIFNTEQVRCGCGCGTVPVLKNAWHTSQATGYPSGTPQWLAVWLMIIADNTMHLAINFLSLKYL